MNRTMICCTVLSCLFCSAKAQQVIYSAYQKHDVRGNDFTVVGKVGNKIWAYRSNNEGFYLDAYSDSMKKTATVVLDFFPDKIYETRFIAYPDKMIVLYQGNESNTITQYAAMLDKDGRLIKRPMKLESAKTGFFGGNKQYFSSVSSNNKQYIMVYSVSTKRDNVDFSGILLNDTLGTEKKTSANFKVDNDVNVGEPLLANNGNLYMNAYLPTGQYNYADQLWMLSLEMGSNKFIATEMPLNSMYAGSAFLKMDNVGNKIYVGGFYSEKKNGSYQGVLYAIFDASRHDYSSRKFIAFSERMRVETGERSKRNAFNDFVPRQLIVKNDGGFALVAEETYITTRSTYTPGFGYYSTYNYGPYNSPSIREFHYNDICVFSVDSSGAEQWHSFIRKSQYSTEDGGFFSSYVVLNSGGSLAFLFNDFNTSHSRVQLATVDGDGQTAMHSINDDADDPDWLPRYGKQISARELVVPCLKKRQICFAKVVF